MKHEFKSYVMSYEFVSYKMSSKANFNKNCHYRDVEVCVEIIAPFVVQYTYIQPNGQSVRKIVPPMSKEFKQCKPVKLNSMLTFNDSIMIVSYNATISRIIHCNIHIRSTYGVGCRDYDSTSEFLSGILKKCFTQYTV